MRAGDPIRDDEVMNEPDPAPAGFEALLDLAAPQPIYRMAIEGGGYLRADEGFIVTFTRELSDHVLRHHELFSSVGGLDLGNIRPLIPLNVDPPEHAKYRKILDPLFAPKQMEAQEEDITARVNHFVDGFIDRGECNFTEDFAELLPSSVFLGLMGLPWDELATFLHLRDGILRPDRIDPDARFDPEARRRLPPGVGDPHQHLDRRHAPLVAHGGHHPVDVAVHLFGTEVLAVESHGLARRQPAGLQLVDEERDLEAAHVGNR